MITLSAQEHTDTISMIRNFIFGLWSQDSNQMLSNEGYYFMPDGTFNLVASEYTGEWELRAKDSLVLSYTNWRSQPKIEVMHVDSLNDQYMVLGDDSGKYVFRKVPFGKNPEGIVLNGFKGSLNDFLPVKRYPFELPSARQLSIDLTCNDTNVAFRLFAYDREITSAPMKHWEGILVLGGKYFAQVSFLNKPKKDIDDVEFDLRVKGY